METDVTRTMLLYESVLDIEHKDLEIADIVNAINQIIKAYKKIPNDAPVSIIDYNCSKYRFAYIYLYALCHTTIVDEHLKKLETNSFETFRQMLKLEQSRLNLCSLGGGPGCDVIGVLKNLEKYSPSLAPSTVDCTIIDLCEGWNQSFCNVLDNFLQSDIGKCYRSRLSSCFMKADICSVLDNVTICALRKADLLTMVKFVSVVAYYCKEDSKYLQELFRLMKSGSYLIFLDNSTGGFYEMVLKSAEDNGLNLLYTVKTYHRHSEYMKFSKYKFNKKPLSFTSVIFAVWKKN